MVQSPQEMYSYSLYAEPRTERAVFSPRRQNIRKKLLAYCNKLECCGKVHFFSVVTLKDIIKYLQKCEGCAHFCEIL